MTNGIIDYAGFARHFSTLDQWRRQDLVPGGGTDRGAEGAEGGEVWIFISKW